MKFKFLLISFLYCTILFFTTTVYAETPESSKTSLDIEYELDVLDDATAEAVFENNDEYLLSYEFQNSILSSATIDKLQQDKPIGPEISCVSGILVEVSSGTVMYSKNADEKLPPASITKVMTMLLIMEAIESGKIKYDQMVPISTYAASMGGSQVFLEPGEEMSVHEMLKSIAVASANDACVAMAEFIAGSEEAFVNLMNEKAKLLGMTNTSFKNSNGLDVEGHYSSASDIAKMTLELCKHPDIYKYTTIWTDTIRNGAFGLANTNKLVRFYQGATGMKTGFTSKAKYCVSATAKRDEMELVSVVMGGETSPKRFEDAKKLLNFGYANWCVYKDVKKDEVYKGTVLKGKSNSFFAQAESPSNILLPKGKSGDIKKRVELQPELLAPIEKGQNVGRVIYTLEDKEIATYPIIVKEGIGKLNFFDYFTAFFKMLFLG